MQYFLLIIYTIIMTFAMLYAWHKLLDKKLNYKNPRLYISIITITILTILNILVTNKFMKITIITIIMMLFFKYLFNEKIQKCIITPIFTQLLIFAFEFIYVASLSIILNKTATELFSTPLSMFLENLVIAIIIMFLPKFKLTKNIYNGLLNITDKINSIYLGLFCFMGILILNILVMNSYYKIKFSTFLIINVVLIVLILIVIFYSIKTQNKYNKVSDKYNIAIKSLNDYEDMMTKYRIANHENKNLLLTVRAMILNKDKDIPNYIDSIIEEKYVDDEKLLFEMSVIPSGGLRATIYSKILKIKDSKIDYSLNIDRRIKTIDLINLETSSIVDICKIIGVFMDNSIESVKKLKKKNINIELYMEDNNLCIKVSNNYKGNIDVSKLSDEGYTTKGKDHGYGLSLVKEIINNNSLFENKTEIKKDIFSQILIIKYKKRHIK